MKSSILSIHDQNVTNTTISGSTAKLDPFVSLFKRIMIRAPRIWLGLDFSSSPAIDNIATLLAALTGAHRILWSRGESWGEIDSKALVQAFELVSGTARMSTENASNLPASALAFIAPIGSEEVWASLFDFDVEMRKSFDVTARDHILCSGFYGLTFLWTWFAKIFANEQAYYVKNAEPLHLSRCAFALQQTVTEAIDHARLAQGEVVAAHDNGYDVKYDDEVFETNVSEQFLIRRSHDLKATSRTYGEVEEDYDAVLSVGDRVRARHRVVDQAMSAPEKLMAESWLEQLVAAALRAIKDSTSNNQNCEGTLSPAQKMQQLKRVEETEFGRNFKAKLNIGLCEVARRLETQQHNKKLSFSSTDIDQGSRSSFDRRTRSFQEIDFRHSDTDDGKDEPEQSSDLLWANVGELPDLVDAMMLRRLETLYEHSESEETMHRYGMSASRSREQFGNQQLGLEVFRSLYAFGNECTWLSGFMQPLRTTNVSGLVKLSLACCCIFDEGAVVIAEVLRAGKAPIELLDLRLNFIGDVGIVALAAVCKSGKSFCLTELNLEGNLVSNDSAETMINSVASGLGTHSLRRLIMTDLTDYHPGVVEIHKEMWPEYNPNTPCVLPTFDVLPQCVALLDGAQFTLECRPSAIRKPPPDSIFLPRAGGALACVDIHELSLYYERLDSSRFNTTLKLGFIGVGTAGKTSLSNRLRGVQDENTLSYLTATESRTVGIDINRWQPNENVTFKIWDFAGQSNYGITHQFFLSEFSLNCIVVDINRYALDKDAAGRIDVVAYHLEQTFGYDIRDHLPVIKEPIVQSDQIYRECWQQICEQESVLLEDIEALLSLDDKSTFLSREGRLLLTDQDANTQRLLGSKDPLLQPERDCDIIRDRAQEAQLIIKNKLAPGSLWASTLFNDAFISSHTNEEATKLRTASRLTTPEVSCKFIAAIYDPWIKSRARMVEKARFKYDSRFERIRDVSRLAIQCDSIAHLLRCYDFIQQNFVVVKVENRFAHPTALGWRDIQLLIEIPLEAPASVHIAELQLQLVGFATARRKAHTFYRILRERLTDALRDVPRDVDKVQHFLLDQINESIDGATLFDHEIQKWIDILQNRTASTTGAKYLLVASKIDLCPDKFERKAAAMVERVRRAERARRDALVAEIAALDGDEWRVQDAKAIKRHRLMRKGGLLKAAALEKVSKKRKREFERLLKIRPVMLDDRIYCVSARTGEGVEELKQACIRAANRINFPFFGEEVPKCDLDLADKVEELRIGGTPYLQWSDYIAISRKCGIQERHIRAVTRGLQRRGHILYFDEAMTETDSALSRLVFTDCQWIIDVLKAVIRHDVSSLLDEEENAALGRGMLNQSTARRLWSATLSDERIINGLEDLLIKFELAVPISQQSCQRNDQTYLIPAFLPPDLPEAAQMHWDRAAARIGHASNVSVGVRIEFRFGIPRGFFERCIVRLLKLFQPSPQSGASLAETLDVVCWKNGFLRVGLPLLRVDLLRTNGIDSVDITSRHTVGDESAKSRALALTSAWAINNTAKFCTGELLTEWPGLIFALKVVCPSCLRQNIPGAATWAIEEFVHCTNSSTISCDVCKEHVPLNLCVPPLELAIKDVKRVQRIAARWKDYQRRTHKHLSMSDSPIGVA